MNIKKKKGRQQKKTAAFFYNLFVLCIDIIQNRIYIINIRQERQPARSKIMTMMKAKINLTNYNNHKMGWTETATNIFFDENKVHFDTVLTTFGDIVTREFEQVESIKDYENSIYIYARNTLNNDKYRIVIYK